MATFAGLWGAQQFIDSTTGNPLHSTPFTVYTNAAGTILATLYTTRTKSATAANPGSTDVYGNGYFFADPGIYYIKCQNVLTIVEVYEDPSESPDSSLYSAKGSFLVATAPATPADFAVGTNDYMVMADSSTGNGVKWASPAVVRTALGIVATDAGGWVSAGETWTYVSADGPTGVFSVAADVTTKYSVGMRVRYVQTTTKYGIITAVGAFSAGSTPITIYGGTDYTTANAAITVPFYSLAKAPFGFPVSQIKWTVLVTDTADRVALAVVGGTWTNLNAALTISVPIGQWHLGYEVIAQASTTAGSTAASVGCGMGTTINAAPDQRLRTFTYIDNTVVAATATAISAQTRYMEVLLAAKTSYFLNTVCAAIADLHNRGDTATTVLKALCGYL